MNETKKILSRLLFVLTLTIAGGVLALGQAFQYQLTRTDAADAGVRSRLESRLNQRIDAGAISSQEIARERQSIESMVERASEPRTILGKYIIFADETELSVIEDVPYAAGETVHRLSTWTDRTITLDAPISHASGTQLSQLSYSGTFRIHSGRGPFREELVYALTGYLDPVFTVESVSDDGTQVTYVKPHPRAAEPMHAGKVLRMVVVYSDSARTQPRELLYLGSSNSPTGTAVVTGFLGQPGHTVHWQSHGLAANIEKIFSFEEVVDAYFSPSAVALGAKMSHQYGKGSSHLYTWNGEFEEPPAAGFSMPIYAILFVAGGVAIAAGVWVSIRR